MNLTDAMINEALQNTAFATRSPWEMIIILSVVVIVFVIILFKVENKRIKVLSAVLAVMFILIGINSIEEDFTIKNAIQNEEWIIVTDTVDRVMESKKNGKTTGYFMVLEEYGRVSFDSYSEAAEHYPGGQVYAVVIPHGDECLKTGIAYSKDKYTYVGNH